MWSKTNANTPDWKKLSQPILQKFWACTWKAVVVKMLRRMSVSEYRKWLKDERSRHASEPGFFKSGAKRTENVLAGRASEESVARWKSFKARHGTAYLEKPTYKRAIALRNWGIAVPVPRRR